MTENFTLTHSDDNGMFPEAFESQERRGESEREKYKYNFAALEHLRDCLLL